MRGSRQTQPSDPLKRADAAFHAGYAAQRSGDLEQAREKFGEVVKLAPRIAEGHEALGALLLEMNRAPEAIAELETAARLKPGDAGNEANLALAYAAAGEAAKAIPHFEQALRGKGGSPSGQAGARLLDAYARSLAAVGNVDAAIAQLAAEERIAGERADLEDAIGSLYAQQKQWDAARKRFEHAVELDGTLAIARVHLGVVLREQGDLSGSLMTLEAVAKGDPPDARAEFEYGRTLAAAGRDDEAARAVRCGAEVESRFAGRATGIGDGAATAGTAAGGDSVV